MGRFVGVSRLLPNVNVSSRRNFHRPAAVVLLIGLSLAAGLSAMPSAGADALEHIRQSRQVHYGSDMEGGGPYAYPDPALPGGMGGFEVELMEDLANDLGAAPVFCQGQWDKLLQVLDSGRIDMVANGYEWTEPRGGITWRPDLITSINSSSSFRAAAQSEAGPTSKNPSPGAVGTVWACWSARRPIPLPPSKGAQASRSSASMARPTR